MRRPQNILTQQPATCKNKKFAEYLIQERTIIQALTEDLIWMQMREYQFSDDETANPAIKRQPYNPKTEKSL